MAMVGMLIVVLMIPLGMIKSLIHEREYNYNEVRNELSMKYGGTQDITGPILSVPVLRSRVLDGVKVQDRTYIHLLPEQMKVSGNLDTSIRRRNIYQLMAYNADLKFKARFNPAEFDIDPADSAEILWSEATVDLGISHLRGLMNHVEVKAGGNSYKFKPGAGNPDLRWEGMHVDVEVRPDQLFGVKFELSLRGSEAIYFYPLAKELKVSLSSNCPNPSFSGDYLPEYSTSDEGFKAGWNLLEFNEHSYHSWEGNSVDLKRNPFGVVLMLDVEHYQKTSRSVKYALLLIALSFLAFFCMEFLMAKRLHPIQYSLIGLALVVFFVLLLSLSEYTGFNLAYISSAGAVLILIYLYISSSLSSHKLAALVCSLMVVIYLFIFIILQMANYSLLFGSVGLFFFLAAAMLLTRKIDWYNIVGTKNKE
jgi:inner membrane protein